MQLWRSSLFFCVENPYNDKTIVIKNIFWQLELFCKRCEWRKPIIEILRSANKTISMRLSVLVPVDTITNTLRYLLYEERLAALEQRYLNRWSSFTPIENNFSWNKLPFLDQNRRGLLIIFFFHYQLHLHNL